MWLIEFHKLVSKAAKLACGHELDYDGLEQAFEPARRRMQVGPDELLIIQNRERWPYPRWYPPLSHTIASPINLPGELKDERAKKEAIKRLYEPLRHIEVVSVILRFLCPEQFGIISPPVVAILSLIPKTGEQHVDHYFRYIAQLLDMATHYKVLSRAADVDMALWSAAHLLIETKYKSLTGEMEADEYFQEARLRNLLEGFGLIGPENNRQRLLFARVLVERDYISAADIAARVFEAVLDMIGRKLHINKWDLPRKNNESGTGALVRHLDKRKEIRELGVNLGDLIAWWEWRNDAIHPDRQITPEDARNLVQAVNKLWRRHETWKRK
jgi:hypothetical protein